MSKIEAGHACWQAGQTLVEVLVAITVVVIVLGAFAIATIVSIRNAQFSQNQAQATKLAQEGIDKIKLGRSKDVNVFYSGDPTPKPFSQFLADDNKCSSICYFSMNNTLELIEVTSVGVDGSLTDATFKRFIQVIRTAEASEKKFTVIVSWTDTSGSHESRLQTLLSQI